MTVVVEDWRVVPGYAPYEVSSLGRVRRGQRMLRGFLDSDGYRKINTCIDGVAKHVPVHTMVLLAFVGPRPSGQEACHGGAGKSVNEADNLSWGTHQKQYRDRMRDGTDSRGERNVRAKLTRAQAEEVKRVYVPRCPINGGLALARRFEVSLGAIDGIVNKGGWK